jgi:hypothetical protein
MELSNTENRKIRVSDKTRVQINDTLVEPSYVKDVTNLLKGKNCWRITGQTFETVSKVFVAMGSIISFAAGVYDQPTLSFVSGAVSTFSLATLQFASFSYKENKKQATELNVLLKTLDLDTIPVNERTADDTTIATFRQSSGNTPQRFTPQNNKPTLQRQNTIPNVPWIPYTEFENYVARLEEDTEAIRTDASENRQRSIQLQEENIALKNEIENLIKRLEPIQNDEIKIEFHNEDEKENK